MISRRLLLLLLVAIATSWSLAQRPTGLTAEQVWKINQRISAEMAARQIPGLSLALVDSGRLIFSKGYGFADVENHVPATPQTTYRLASLSKPITATAVMQLVEKGKLDLDEPIQKYCAAFPQKPWPITARELLSHQSGIRHYRNEAETISTRHYGSIQEALGQFKDDPLLFEPRTRFSYSTYGYTVLGCAIEGASGMSYGEYMRENIFRRAGMDSTELDDVYRTIPNRAHGYALSPGHRIRNATFVDVSNKLPGGGINSTAEDMAKYVIALLAGKLIKQTTLDEMLIPARLLSGEETAYGYGWFVVSKRKGQREVEHSGGQQGVATFLYLLPDRGFAVVILSNLERAGLSVELCRQVYKIVRLP